LSVFKFDTGDVILDSLTRAYINDDSNISRFLDSKAQTGRREEPSR
jgi:hypothetical protein